MQSSHTLSLSEDDIEEQASHCKDHPQNRHHNEADEQPGVDAVKVFINRDLPAYENSLGTFSRL